MEGVEGAASAWVADDCYRELGRDLSPGEEGQHAELVRAAKITEVDAWRKFDVSRAGKCPFGHEASWAGEMGSRVEDGGWREKRRGAIGGE